MKFQSVLNEGVFHTISSYAYGQKHIIKGDYQFHTSMSL